MWLKLNVLIFFKNHTVSFLLAKTRKTKYLKKHNNSLKFILKEDFFSTTGIMLITSLFCK